MCRTLAYGCLTGQPSFKQLVCNNEKEKSETKSAARPGKHFNFMPAIANILPSCSLNGSSAEREQFLACISQLVALEDLPTDEDEGCAFGTATVAPAPRCNHTTAVWRSDEGPQMVVFGGHGGSKYARRSFNDVWVLDIKKQTWKEMRYTGNAPAPRCGHCAALRGNYLFIFGGWNAETQFNDLFVYDLIANDWSDMDMPWRGTSPRWNFGYQLVEAIPDWKLFVFGGCCAEAGDGQKRYNGVLMNDVGILTLGNEKKWEQPALEEPRKKALKGDAFEHKMSLASLSHLDLVAKSDPSTKPAPRCREHTAISYDSEESVLIVFGGWSGQWLDDIWALNVSSIVGPPYAVTNITPNFGPISGNTPVTLEGVGFVDGIITVRFQSHDHHADVSAEFVGPTQIKALTPCVKGGIGSKECEIRVKIGVKDFTTTWTTFSFYNNTVAAQTLAYGPGLLLEGCPAVPTMFVIQARNGQGGNRLSGNDVFKVIITHKPKDKSGPVNLESEIVDAKNGTYTVRYHAKVAGETVIEIYFVDDDKEPEPIRGSPFAASFVDKAKARANDMAGPLITSYISKTIADMDSFHAITEAGVHTTVKADDVKSLLIARYHIAEMEKQKGHLLLQRETVQAILGFLEKLGSNTESNAKALKSATAKLGALE